MFKKYWQLFLFLAVFVFLFILSSHEYNRFPYEVHGEEQAFAWAGLSLLKEGTPVSWSHFEYPEGSIVYSGPIGNEPHQIFVDLVEPWFDHPPTFSTMAALISYANGLETQTVLPAIWVRLPNMIAFWLSLAFVFLLARKLFGYWTGMLAMIIYGTVPTFVFAGRLAVPEGFFALFLTVMSLAWIKFRESKNLLWIVLIAVLAGFAGTMKFTGFFLLPLFVFLALRERHWKAVVILILLQIPFVLGILYYSYSINWEVFWLLTQRQGFRPVGWSSLPFILSTPGFDISPLYDGWLVLGMLSIFFFAISNRMKNMEMIVLPAIYWIAVVVISSGQQDANLWYRYPIFPFAAISLALTVQKIVKSPRFVTSFLVVGTLLSQRHYLSNAFRSDMSPSTFRPLFFALLSPSLFYELNLNKRKLAVLSKGILVFVFLVGVWLNIKLIYGIFPLWCESMSCPIGPSNWISDLRFPIIWRWLLPR